MLGIGRAKCYFIGDIDCDSILIKVILCKTTPVYERGFWFELLFEVAVCSLPSLNSRSIELILESLPAEYSLLEYLLQVLVAFQLLLTSILLIFLHIMMQVNFDGRAVHGLPDIVQTEINNFFEHSFIY